MPPSERPARLALVGPTASGKSALAVAVAGALGDVEIVSADAMSVYRGMDVGTAKPTLADRGGIAHHVIDVADPAEEWSVARYQAAALAAVTDIEGRGRRPLLVGGTGLYVRAVVDGLDLPGEHPGVRAELDAEPDTASLHARLADLDPAAAARMLPGNRRRVVRALEVTLGTGRPFSSFGPGLGSHPPSTFEQVGVWLPRPAGAAAIAERFARQMAAGFLDEVRRLAAGPWGRTAAQALGYRELAEHLAGRTGLDEAVDAAVARTRAFARRQRVWFRRDPRVTWMGTPGNALALVPALLGDWGR